MSNPEFEYKMPKPSSIEPEGGKAKRERRKATEREFDNRYLADIEHFINGSTPQQAVNNDIPQLVEPRIELLASRGDEAVYNSLLTPGSLKTDGIEVVMSERERERHMRTRRGKAGGLLIEGKAIKQLKTDRKREEIGVFIEPSEMDSETGLIKPEWRIFFVNKKGEFVRNDVALRDLKLDSDPNDPDYLWYFSLSDVNEDGCVILTFDPRRKTTDPERKAA